ncbi:MAG: beta-N-acetylhexosaminidase [Bacteroidetes bacterium]|nr:MAG: beta-N-acetylhexosaminidase [Bacteroidota bacterium]
MSKWLVLLLCLPLFSQSQDIKIIPEPVSITEKTGSVTLNTNSSILVVGNNPDAIRVAKLLSEALSKPTGYKFPVKSGSGSKVAGNNISFQLNSKADESIGKEGYKLTVGTNGINISANTPAGLFYGTQTLIQLLPTEIESKTEVKGVKWTAPAVEISDYPRFGWRGLMFDVSRHFFTKQEVKQYIDDMVKYKYNLLHLHLTDDEGWRVEIKSLPKLTEVGAWNVYKVGTFGNFTAPTPDEPRNFGGFYTQDDIRELVQYAKDRFMNILPEIDIPGHSLAAVASYPELSCTQGSDKYTVHSGEKFMNWTDSGNIALMDNTLCPANENVYAFYDKVFTEIAQLFPFEYIHMGGDECAKNFWKKSDAVAQLMKRENLKDMNEVQSYFVKRIEKIIESKGKKLIGWDEILEGGLAPNAAVMSWRGIKGGIEAAKMGHEVVMSPTTFVYIDYMQADAVIEPPVYATLRLKTSYEFEPVPDGVDPKFVKGGQANLWTEQVYNLRHAQYMTWPRGFAVAEALWSPKEKRNWSDFVPRVEKQFERYDVAEKKYAPSVYDPIFKAEKDSASGKLIVEMSTEIDGLDIFYSFDNSFPDKFYPKYEKPIVVPKDASTMKVITYRNGKPIGRLNVMPVAELEKRATRKRR